MKTVRIIPGAKAPITNRKHPVAQLFLDIARHASLTVADTLIHPKSKTRTSLWLMPDESIVECIGREAPSCADEKRPMHLLDLPVSKPPIPAELCQQWVANPIGAYCGDLAHDPLRVWQQRSRVLRRRGLIQRMLRSAGKFRKYQENEPMAAGWGRFELGLPVLPIVQTLYPNTDVLPVPNLMIRTIFWLHEANHQNLAARVGKEAVRELTALLATERTAAGTMRPERRRAAVIMTKEILKLEVLDKAKTSKRF